MRWFWEGILRLGRWKTVGEVPPLPKMVIIGAPHTSNWDFPIGMLAARALGVKIRFLGKHTLFRPPFGWFFRMLGGIPVDRSRPGGIIGQIGEAFASTDRLTMVIAPEGTRSHRPYWKSGFYEIARAAGVPVVLARIDVPFKRALHLLILLPIISPPFVGAVALLFLFGFNGLVTKQLLGLQDFNIYGRFGVVASQIFTFAPRLHRCRATTKPSPPLFPFPQMM